MTRNLRKLALTVHISLAVGWIGAVAAYLVLVIAAMSAYGTLVLRAAWIAMGLIGWYLIVPIALASLLTGIMMSLGTPWGLFRHYWTMASLTATATATATAVLIQHMRTVSVFARLAADTGIPDFAALRGALSSELLHAGVGMVVLLTINAMNIYKPIGMTSYGRRRAFETAVQARAVDVGQPAPHPKPAKATPLWVRALGYHAVGVAVLFVIMHIVGRGGLH